MGDYAAALVTFPRGRRTRVENVTVEGSFSEEWKADRDERNPTLERETSFAREKHNPPLPTPSTPQIIPVEATSIASRVIP
jgi:hypothetical protein